MKWFACFASSIFELDYFALIVSNAFMLAVSHDANFALFFFLSYFLQLNARMPQGSDQTRQIVHLLDNKVSSMHKQTLRNEQTMIAKKTKTRTTVVFIFN